MIDKGIEYFLLLLGLVAVGGALFSFIFFNYQKLEGSVMQAMADYAAELYDYLDRMFKRRTMNECYVIIIVPTTAFGLIGLAAGLGINLQMGLVLAVLLAALGFRLPKIVIRAMFQRRVALFDRQLVDALNMMANAIKSGLSFMQVVKVIEQEMPKPCSEEFGMVLKENRVGVNLNDALLNMAKRMPSDDLFMIINSVVTLSQQGGDLSEAFETIAETIRERQRVSDKIKTLAQAGMTQAAILSSLPFLMLGIQVIIQPAYVRLLFVTPLGWAFLAAMLMFIAAGVFWMSKILTIDI